MVIEDLIGEFSVIGNNQNEEQTIYKGILTLSLNTNKQIKVQWLISGTQIQKGTGFFKNNILVINFNYADEENNIYKGVVVYKCLSKDIFEGFWSEKHGNPLFLGEECCFRINNNQPSN
ncbi:hypothetical protein [Neotamlana laminarinivorans]|uniref:Uncharacterized protein n=1 Tax=Neotamlana laminarinivorans TaxID=2883124 RepID=A0A9X1L512_9FLAO|nr:hypothetical protein [Tamlana laminarinivorans]MCB4800039.1 hypothetical protein [Tamlana laminarinivorans]